MNNGSLSPTEKLDLMRVVSEREAEGRTFPSACAAAGASEASIRRWRREYRAGGLAALENGKSSGRRSVARHLTPEAVAKIRELVMKNGSVKLSYDVFVNDPLCPEEVRQELLKEKASGHSIPRSLRRVAQTTPELQAMHRGTRTFDLQGFISLRDMTELMPDGTRRPIAPGDWWELDDMSLNTPFWYQVDPKDHPDSPLAQKYGALVGRQSLWAMDVASAKWLGFELIGRRKDAYRAEDILRFLRRLFQTWGLPRRGLRLERGVWMSNRIKGFQPQMHTDAHGSDADLAAEFPDYERPEMVEEERKVIVGGLAKLGLEVVYCYSPHTKGLIEGGFDHLQSIMTTLGDH